MEKALKRMMEKRQIQIEAKKKERQERKEEIEQKKWNDEGCTLGKICFCIIFNIYLVKKQERKQVKEDKKFEAHQRKLESKALADQEVKNIEEGIKSRQRKHK